MKLTPSSAKWIGAVSARHQELTSEIDRVNLEIYLEEDAIDYLKSRIEDRDSDTHVNDTPGDFELENVLGGRKTRLKALQSLQKAISSEMNLVAAHRKALSENWSGIDEDVLKVIKRLFDAEME